MITGEMKNKVDAIWDTIWTGGITSPITVLEQITYLMFMKLLDDNQLKAEANANLLGVPLKNKVFQDGIWAPQKILCRRFSTKSRISHNPCA